MSFMRNATRSSNSSRRDKHLKKIEHNEGFAYAYGWNFYYQKILGLCAMEGEGPIARQRAWFLTLWIFFSIWLPGVASLPIIWGNLDLCIDCLSTYMPIVVTMTKMIVLQCHRKVTGSIVLQIIKDWSRVVTKEEYKIMFEIAKISKTISIISVFVTGTMFFAYIISRLWLSLENNIVDPRLASGLLHDSYFPFDTTKLIIFVPIWISQFFGTFLGMVTYVGPDCLASMMVLHLCGQLRIICNSLKCIVDETTIREPKTYWQNIADIVERHEELNELTFKINYTFSTILLIQILACSVTFCFQCYAMFTNLVDRNGRPFPFLELFFALFYAMYTVIHLFIYCYVGDRLLVESTSLADDFYETAWYDLAPQEAKAFLFVCQRSRIPLEMKAGKFCTFNFQLFNSIMKSSMGYLSMLMAMKERL